MRVTDENTTGIQPARKIQRRALAEINNVNPGARVISAEMQTNSENASLSDYLEEILMHYKKEETKYMPSPDYMDFQEELRWAMRSVLIDWIIDVHFKLSLLPETLYLAVNLIDRFLSLRIVTIGKLQLVGVAGLLIASKFEEVASPSVETFVVLTDRSFTENEILRAEKYMLHCLDYKINYPSPLNWIRQTENKEIEKMAIIILDSLLPEEAFLKYSSSVLGASAAYCAIKVLSDSTEEIENLYSFTMHSSSDLAECISEIRKYLQKPILHSSIFKKHGTSFTKYLDRLNK